MRWVYGRNGNTIIPIFNYDIGSLQKFSLIIADFIIFDVTSYDKSSSSIDLSSGYTYNVYLEILLFVKLLCFRNK